MSERSRRELDHRAAAAIEYTIDVDADRVLIDEREGRATATRHDAPVTGVVGDLKRVVETGSPTFKEAVPAAE